MAAPPDDPTMTTVVVHETSPGASSTSDPGRCRSRRRPLGGLLVLTAVLVGSLLGATGVAAAADGSSAAPHPATALLRLATPPGRPGLARPATGLLPGDTVTSFVDLAVTGAPALLGGSLDRSVSGDAAGLVLSVVACPVAWQGADAAPTCPTGALAEASDVPAAGAPTPLPALAGLARGRTLHLAVVLRLSAAATQPVAATLRYSVTAAADPAPAR